MIRLVSLSSGSCGNAVYIESARTKILIDAGTTIKYLGEHLAALGTKIDEIEAILLTHEHSDHIRSAHSLSRKYGIKILANADTLDALPTRFGVANIRVFPGGGDSFQVGDFEVQAVPHSHDCRSPVGFVLKHNKKKICIATDLGCVTSLVEDGLRGAHIVVLESNHDFSMLAEGHYPPRLKARISSKVGHLSNTMAGRTLARLATGKPQKVLLAHLSQSNNSPDVAMKTVEGILSNNNIDSIELGIAPRLAPSVMLTA